MNPPVLPSVLIVDDHEPSVRTLRAALRDEPFELETASSADEALRLVRSRPFDVVVTDLRMPGFDGLTFMRRTREIQPACAVVVMTGYASVDTARQALSQGATEYITKPIAIETELKPLLRRLVGETRPKPDAARAGAGELSLVGAAPSFQRTVDKARRLARSDAPVLLLGESGTGKDVFAQFIHALSDRRDGPFVPINCAAVPDPLLESEMFGYAKGAFSGADADKIGFFHAAHGGTIFLDEIGELPLALQPKLLQVLQAGSFYRVGGAGRVQSVDVRVIAATNRDLQAAAADGSFRRDLYYRLGVLPLPIPALREREGDVPLMLAHFLEKLAPHRSLHFSPQALDRLRAYSWPGNVRELANAVEHALVLHDEAEDEIGESVLPPGVLEEATAREGAVGIDDERTLEQVEIAAILAAMRRCGLNQTRAARQLGVSRRTLQYRIEKHGLQERLRGVDRGSREPGPPGVRRPGPDV